MKTNRYVRGCGEGLIVVVLAIFLAAPAMAGEFTLNSTNAFRVDSVGVRGGYDAERTSDHLSQTDVFGNWDLPWSLGQQDVWRLQTRLEASAGWLGKRSHNAFIGTIGPGFIISFHNFPLSIEGGVSATALSEDRFRPQNFGSLFEFISHAGLNYDIGEHWRIGYRFQHMSNAGIAHPNPGLNMHMFSVSFLF
ncbi:MAG TPA: acyloxyacyl hydrolase [Verrucomicrobiae bacterium]|nr:acyloxyacyl hydrolase [Verrucomicrobiae bacterium]